MKEYSFKCKIYIISVISLAYLITFYYAFSVDFNFKSFIAFIFFVFISIVSESIAIPLPKGGFVSATYAIDYAVLIIFGAPIASYIIIFGTLLNRKYGLGKEKLHRTLFNSAQAALSIIVAGIVFNIFLKLINNFFVSSMVAALTYYVINATTVTIVLALSNNVSLWKIWYTNMRWALPNLFALAPIGLLMMYAYQHYYIWGVAVLFIPLLVGRYSFKLYMEMREILADTITTLVNAIEAKDPYTKGHSVRVAQYATNIAKQLKLSEVDIESLELMALLHDIGKIGIPKEILNKNGPLTEEEFTLIKTHPEIGAGIIKQIKFFGDDYKYIRHHHEKVNGRGYPYGIKGEEIPLGARIIAMADAFDAMTVDRSYRKSISWMQTIEELLKNAGEQHDPKVVNAFMQAYDVRIDEITYSQDYYSESAASEEM